MITSQQIYIFQKEICVLNHGAFSLVPPINTTTVKLLFCLSIAYCSFMFIDTYKLIEGEIVAAERVRECERKTKKHIFIYDT